MGERATVADSGRAEPHRVVLVSIGTAGVSHLPVLRRLRAAPDARLAELLLQAPSELAVLDDAAAAAEVSELLNASGLDTAIEPAARTFVAGEGEFDIAVYAEDPARVTELLGLTRTLLGVGAEAARDLLCGSPPAMLGNVSAATIEALTPRFAALGATLVASRRADARYDLVVGRCPPRVLERLLVRTGTVAADANAAGLGGPGPDAPVLIEDLGRAEAELLCAELARSASEAKVVDRAFERFDVRVDACPATLEIERCLIALSGMPADIARRVPYNLPLVLLSGVDRATMREGLDALAAAGATASADMITFRPHRVRVDRVASADDASRVIEAVTGATAALGSLPCPIGPSLSLVQARWLVHELAAVGAESCVVMP